MLATMRETAGLEDERTHGGVLEEVARPAAMGEEVANAARTPKDFSPDVTEVIEHFRTDGERTFYLPQGQHHAPTENDDGGMAVDEELLEDSRRKLWSATTKDEPHVVLQDIFAKCNPRSP